MSNLSELLPSGAGQNQVEFVASGTLPNGKPVILKADGTVEVIGISAGLAHGASSVFETPGPAGSTSVAMLTSTKAIVVYIDAAGSGYTTAVVLEISGSTITAGTPFQYDGDSDNVDVVMLTSTKVLSTWRSGSLSNQGLATVLLISGTTISKGSDVVFETNYLQDSSLARLSSTQAIVCYRDHGGTNYGTSCIISVSGSTTVTVGTPAVFESASTYDVSVATFSSTKAIVCYQDAGNGSYLTARILSISGSSVSAGTEIVFANSASTLPLVDVLSSTKAIVVFSDQGNSYYGTSRILDISGTTISITGNATVYDSSQSRDNVVAALSATEAVVTYRDGNNKGSYSKLSVSGVTITATTPTIFLDSYINQNAITMLTPTKVIATYRNAGASNIGAASIIETATTNLTSTNLIGISAADAADTATAKINVWGGINSSVVPPAGALTTYAITVANASGNKYFIDTVQQDTPALTEGNTYKFDQSDSTNSGHPLRFSTTANGSHGGGSVYSSGVTVVGTPGNAGSYTQIVVPTDAPTLYYYCTAHSGMGSSVTTPAAAALIIGSDYYVHTDGSINTTTTGGQKIGTAISTTTINMKDLT
jgi:hypothetical protein